MICGKFCGFEASCCTCVLLNILRSCCCCQFSGTTCVNRVHAVIYIGRSCQDILGPRLPNASDVSTPCKRFVGRGTCRQVTSLSLTGLLGRLVRFWGTCSSQADECGNT
ncbi:uncharacterized protein EI90DRAFT_3075690 [Cantharellus anzutake]|uniref:uncharacterized protein n=1 Tax=Cantharellus anzutake TaxID=1750568 RepID=UPI0019049040|nr:uncharacterized protein EI90DRAFT_3075690 [Cantharellus anzutake]KAF8324286.1 hypothetical protein EI90DRAFT_3075690 [Cantharellus anzutake]